MCGIYGQYNIHGADPALIERMGRCLVHRGPDGSGAYHRGKLAFGAGRLAIIDLAAGVQPIFSEDRRTAVVYNGEIYNHKALRADLETCGHVFATHTDTEVLVHGYETWGVDVIQRLRGMFALAIWDETNERLVLARDRLGEKPLYYAQAGDSFLFASEIKALFECPQLKRGVAPDALDQYLALSYVMPPLTMFEGVKKLAPGEMVILQGGAESSQRYWTLQMDTTASLDYQEAVRATRQALAETVRMQLMSDVPIGAFLSGGVDSSAVVALMTEALHQPVHTFTVGFDFPPNSQADTKFNVDVHYADLVAKSLGTHHHLIKVKQGPTLAELLPHLIYALDEPVAQPSIVQTALVAALARQNGVPVLLNGSAGDELFLGYEHFRTDQILARYLKIPRILRDTILTPFLERIPERWSALRKLAQKSRHLDLVSRYLAWMRNMDVEDVAALLGKPYDVPGISKHLNALLLPSLEMPETRHFADRIAYTSLLLSVAENGNIREDKMAMLSSVETRSPLLDYQLVDLALHLPLEHKLRKGNFKAVFKDAMADSLPIEVLARTKWGFFAPSSEWLRGPLRPLVDTYLSPACVRSAGYFQPEVVSQLVDDHMAKRRYNLWPLWTLLTFHLWHALYIDGSLQLDHKLGPSELLEGAIVLS